MIFKFLWIREKPFDAALVMSVLERVCFQSLQRTTRRLLLYKFFKRMEFLPAYEGLTKLISVEDDIRNWCFKPFKAILTCVKYASTTILSQYQNCGTPSGAFILGHQLRRLCNTPSFWYTRGPVPVLPEIFPLKGGNQWDLMMEDSKEG
ncbi:hypothetical protein HID58_087536 [Brassica napus]|uniref:Uncharacterized protein n=1 Tax=Brassica napus TaxID=3708 RepID=A0ABQ7XWI5_BRANA|nr:hypothetical protein HID58_087536 [Brassica napus]